MWTNQYFVTFSVKFPLLCDRWRLLVILTLVIAGLYMLLGEVGRGLKAKAGLYPELIIWAPNIIFQAVGFWLFYRANRR